MSHKLYVIFILLFLSARVHSECSANGCDIDQSDPIKRIYLTSLSDGQVYIDAPSGKESLDCTLAEGKFLVLKSTHPLFKETYSTILAAVMANKKMYIRIRNGSSKCEIAYVQLYLQ